MKRVTFEEALLARAEQLASARGVSVETMLTELLARETALSTETEDAYRARMEMVEMARRPDIARRLIPWTREELYKERLSPYEGTSMRAECRKGHELRDVLNPLHDKYKK